MNMKLAFIQACPLLVSLIIISGCGSKSKDKGIKADISSRARKEIAFAGVNYVVNNGVVYLAGYCPSLKEKQQVEAIVGKIAGVKNVEESIQIAPVILDHNFWIRKAIDSVVQDYPGVTPKMNGDTVVLLGSLPKKQLPDVMKKIQSIPFRSFRNQLTLE
jgi:hypothetical protein